MFINLFQGLDMLIYFNFKDLRSMSFHLWKLSFRVMVRINNSAQKASTVVFGGCEYSMSDILRGIAISKTRVSELDKPGYQSCYCWLLALCLWAVDLTPYRSSSEGGTQATVAIIVTFLQWSILAVCILTCQWTCPVTHVLVCPPHWI